jgi:predicted metal-dependent enzyme (double-stranded beta helix superfamily)
MFDVNQFIADCRGASVASGSSGVLEVVARAVTVPSEILRTLGEPRRAGLHVVSRSPELTILNVVWGPRMCQLPHNHRMWAVIGMYSGREDNIFWRRVPGAPDGRIEAAGAKALSDRDAVPLGPELMTGAIHVYGGDFFAVPRSEWDPERLVEQVFDVEKALALFEESNRLYRSPESPRA